MGRTRGRQEGAGRTPQTEEQPRTVQTTACQLGMAKTLGCCARVGCSNYKSVLGLPHVWPAFLRSVMFQSPLARSV